MEEEGRDEQSAMNGNRYEDYHNHDKSKRRITMLICICLVLTIILLIAMLTLNILRSEKPELVQKTCIKCSTLSELIERSAWKDVHEDKSRDQCCFTTESGWASTLKYFLDQRLSGTHDDIARIQKELELLEDHIINWPNPTAGPFLDCSTIRDCTDKILSRRTAVLHLISDRINISEGLEPTIHWGQEARQGDISLEKDNVSVQVMNTALYHVTAQVKFRVSVPSNQTRNATVLFYVVKRKAMSLTRVDHYKRRFVFHDKMPEHDALLQTVTLLERGDRLYIRFPTSQKTYLAIEPGSHRISIFELS